jgi:bifunctional oligoribonuclease and PAP phosphatase NrnA
MQNHKTTSQAIYQHLESANDVLIVSHQKPDGDTLCANFALYKFLKEKNKNVTSFCLDPVPDSLKFLPYSHNLSNDHKVFTKSYDTIIVVDSGSLDYAGIDGLISAIPSKYTMINIDHHASNPHYGDINLVITDASSTAEVLYRLFMDWKINWDEEMASALVCGIVTDTGGLKNPATTYQSLDAVADLVNKGANPHQIMNLTINNTDIASLRLWGRALERLKKNKKYDLVYTFITNQDLIDCGASESASEGLANFLHILKDGSISMVLKETSNGYVKASLRTTSKTDLSKLAQIFGGGGHKKAAGFSLPGKLVYDNNKLRIV